MAGPEKRIRLDSEVESMSFEEATREVTKAALNKFAQTTGDLKRQESNGESRKQPRKPGPIKQLSIRPIILKDGSDSNLSVNYSVKSDTLVNLIFRRSDIPYQDTVERYKAAVYEYNNGRKLTFFPILFNGKTPAYTCLDCYQVYAVMTAIRSRLDNLYCCKLEELNENTNPLLFLHYCAHSEAVTKEQQKYFAEYAWHFNSRDLGDSLVDNAYAIGRFVKNLCAMDEKLKKFCVDNEGTDPGVLMNYVKRLDYTLTNERHAESFLSSFKQLHKEEITYENGLMFFDELPDSQDSGFSDSPGSNSGLSGRPMKRSQHSPSSATLSPSQSMQKTTPGSKQKREVETTKTRTPQRTPTDWVPVNDGKSTSNQKKNLESELDVRKFITGLLLDAMNTVKNSELQVLYDGLRPIVAKYTPNLLSQFITMIHTIDRQMPNRLRNVELNTNGDPNPWNWTNESQLPTSRPSAFRIHKPRGGSSTHPIVVPDDPADEKS